jgi:hypothetical protein
MAGKVSTNGITDSITFKLTSNGQEIDREVIPVIKDGKNGNDGNNGNDGVSTVIRMRGEW